MNRPITTSPPATSFHAAAPLVQPAPPAPGLTLGGSPVAPTQPASNGITPFHPRPAPKLEDSAAKLNTMAMQCIASGQYLDRGFWASVTNDKAGLVEAVLNRVDPNVRDVVRATLAASSPTEAAAAVPSQAGSTSRIAALQTTAAIPPQAIEADITFLQNKATRCPYTIDHVASPLLGEELLTRIFPTGIDHCFETASWRLKPELTREAMGLAIAKQNKHADWFEPVSWRFKPDVNQTDFMAHSRCTQAVSDKMARGEVVSNQELGYLSADAKAFLEPVSFGLKTWVRMADLTAAIHKAATHTGSMRKDNPYKDLFEPASRRVKHSLTREDLQSAIAANPDYRDRALQTGRLCLIEENGSSRLASFMSREQAQALQAAGSGLEGDSSPDACFKNAVLSDAKDALSNFEQLAKQAAESASKK